MYYRLKELSTSMKEMLQEQGVNKEVIEYLMRGNPLPKIEEDASHICLDYDSGWIRKEDLEPVSNDPLYVVRSESKRF